jgi:Reverse transcriptase (RNA-dependent DNA polymerase)
MFGNEQDNPYSLYNIDSQFHDNTSFCDLLSKTSNSTFLSLNIQSLQSKHEALLSFLNDAKAKNADIDVINLQEIWQIPDLNTIQLPDYNFVYKKRAKFRGGGVGCFIKKEIQYKVIDNLSFFIEKVFECITIEIKINGKKLLISNFYRPPTPHPSYTPSIQYNLFIENLDNLFRGITNYGCEAYVFSDSNVNLIRNEPHTVSLLETALSNGFVQIIKKATRLCNNYVGLIDHIFTNAKNQEITSGTVVNDLSDHFPTFVQIQLSKSKYKANNVVKRDMSEPKMRAFRENLSNVRWENVTSLHDVNDAYDCFWEDFSALYNLHFPVKNCKFNKNIHKKNNFMTTGLLVSRNRKLELLKANLKLRSNESKLAYVNYRNMYNKILRKSKQLYYHDQIKSNKTNPKKLWSVLKEVSTGKTDKVSIDKLSVDGKVIVDKCEIANNFNNFFSTVGNVISDSVQPVDKTAVSYIVDNPNVPHLTLDNTTPGQIVEIIKIMQPKQSCDIDGISLKLLKYIAVEICVPLSHIFNLSLTSGTFPTKLKRSRIVPIFKAGDPENCDNYRPISLLSSISKILEKIVHVKLVNHLDLNNLLYDHQYGFLRGKSTEQTLLHVTDYIAKALNKGDYCIALFLDLKKAFDVVSHEILIQKLQKFGISGTTLDWFKSYLKDRSQIVDIDGNLSEPCNISISVLQGSILGPILFLMYINDLPLSTELKSFLFADDTTGLTSGSSLPQLIDKFNTEIQKLAMWFRANKLCVNTSKTKFIIFHTKGKKIDFEGKTVVFNNNEPGGPVDPLQITPLERIYNENPVAHGRSYKLLGIYFDETFSFNHHVQHLCNKLSRSLFFLMRAKNFVCTNSLKLLYYALIHSNLLYCIGTLTAMSQSNAKKIFIMQKKAVRTISNVKSNTHTGPLFQKHGILPYPKLQKQFILIFMHGIEYEYGPQIFRENWPKNAERNLQYALRNGEQLTVPRCLKESLKNAPLFNFPQKWNELDVNTKLQRNLATFKIEILSKLQAEIQEENEE